MKFWDTSAVVPLLVDEARTRPLSSIYERDPVMLVWWATEVESASAVARLERLGELDGETAVEALHRLEALTAAWQEVGPGEQVRRSAKRLLRFHNLTAADALQLAAALIGAEQHAESLDFVSLDQRLVDAARREGFAVVTRM